ncbi:hypothetical protein LT493_01455 [Streptomyces tricolor]|nr:hypothetical protein [Streptomyces tricolor]
MRRRFRRHPHRRGVPHPGRAGPHRPAQPGAPRCHRVEPDSGDGAGLLSQVPDAFLRDVAGS